MKVTSFRVKPSECAVLLHNVLTCDDAENDADRTVDELIAAVDNNRGWIPRAVLESALYCCNMNDEQHKFWHPKQWTFIKFYKDLLGRQLDFNRYYNFIVELDGED